MTNIAKTIAALGVVAGLGVAALPLSSYAANTADVTLNVEVADAITLTSEDNSVSIHSTNGTPVTDSNQWDTATLQVQTGNTKGYTLYAKTNNVNLTDDQNHNIPAGTPSSTSDSVVSAWGMKVDGTTGGAFSSYAGLTASDQIVNKTSAAPSNSTDDLTVTFGVTTASSQEAGTYTGSATFTATANIE